jgi:hypothetical protein
MMEWAVESNQPMVMMLLDFEKAYNRVEWEFLEGTMDALGFDRNWISWVKALFIDSWCSVGLNGVISPSFKFSRSVRQGCPVAPLLYLLIKDCLGYVLEGEGVEGIALPRPGYQVIDQEFADDTNLYLAGWAGNLNRTKDVLILFASVADAKIN